eukprot:CAMPEP_0179020188 /NCGR_PEP_ID=MMETSP0796-20121207/5253_1 /TAXON_ID=73915 /ORGANISM="Pyrodinium bahamense, Strain pbaha01" /LENGTH=580 /DNA_ID=CAMNT_0020715995 /DNA_START=84 /DNA_END=1826 /DNA_ORIENTATION=+
MAYVGRFDGSESKHASPAMAAASGAAGVQEDVSAKPTSTKWSVLSSRVEGLVEELTQVVGKQDAYCVAQSTGEGPAMRAVREKMLATNWAEEWASKKTMFSYGEEMSTDPLEALLLKQLAHLSSARKILEVGMFVGYGSTAMLEGAPCAEVVSLEIDPYLKVWLADCLKDLPQVSKRHRVVLGPALDSLPTLQGEEFDLIFIDANKAEYKRYVELILEHRLLSPSGAIVGDNVLYNGYPYVDRHFDAQPQRRGFGDAIREFNQWIATHPSLEQVILPVRDGVSFIRLRPASLSVPAAPAGAPEGCVRLRHASGATCDVSVYAAHVLSWCLPGAGEQLFLSSKAILGTPGAAIRGGVPICWPQFGTFETAKDPPRMKHGFVRQSGSWRVCEVTEDSVSLRLTSDAETLKKWPAEFEFIYTVSLAAKSMILKMEVTNIGKEGFEFTGCLHTYFRCEACTDCAVEGLKGEKVDIGIGDLFRGTEVEHLDQVTFDGTSEIQRLYGGTADAITLKDGGRKRFRLLKMNMPDWVLWNIGDANKCTLKDLGDGEQRKYVCVEPGFATVPQRVAAGSTWCGLHEVRAL